MVTLRRGWPAILLVVLCLAIAGCSEPPPPEPDEPPPPPPPTPEELAGKAIADLGLDGPIPKPGSRLNKQAGDKFKTLVQQTKTRLSGSQDGKRALQIVSRKLDQRIRALADAGLSEHVLAHVEAHKILNPGSTKWDTTEELAMAELTKPQVNIIGFLYDGTTGQNKAILEFYLPIRKETHEHQVRVGEEFYGLELVRIIGNNQGVTLEYRETGQTFDVLTKSARQ